MNRELLEQQLNELPLYTYFFIRPEDLEFSQRIRWICENECPRYGNTWACPPATGPVDACKEKCLGYQNCLLVGTITEVEDISDIQKSLETRFPHEELTNLIGSYMRNQGVEPYILSTEACDICERCAYLDGKPCRCPEHMHPCIESHGINIIPTLEANGLEFQYGSNMITWYSLLFFND